MEVFTTSGTYPWSFVTKIFHSGQPIVGCDRKTFEVMTNFPRPSALHTNKEYGMIIFVPK
jgi:hypothetical protein